MAHIPARFRAFFVPAVLLAVMALTAWYFLRPAPIDRSRVYRIGYGQDAPMQFKDASGRPSGLAVELVNEAARRSGVKLEWIEGDGTKFQEIGLDMWVLMTILPERLKNMHFSEAYLQTQSCLIIRADSPYREMSDLAKARISYNHHTVVHDALANLLPDSEKIPLPSSLAAIAALSDGTVDAALVDEYMVISESLEGKPHARFRILPTRSPRRYMAISSTFATAAVADELRRAMQDLADSGELKPVVDRWAFYANPVTDTIGEFSAARRRIPWLVAGVVIMSLIAVAMVGLVMRSRRQAHRLHEAENLLRGIADRVPGLVYQFRQNPDGTFCLPYASEAIRRLYRIGPESVQQNADGFFAPLHPDDRDAVLASLRQSAEQVTPWTCQYRVRFEDGIERWLAASAVPHREPDRAIVWHGFITDITERKAAEASAQAFERKMQETQKLESLGVLAGGIAHDFNNLLTSILGNSNLASLDVPPDSPLQAHLEPIKRGCLRAAELCKQLLAYSGKGRFVVEKVDLHALLDETMELLRHSISKQCELRFNRADGLPPVEGDIAQLRQVIMNLVINASEAISAGPGIITVTTKLVAGSLTEAIGADVTSNGPAGPCVCLEISDTGSGMSEETKARIFEPFFTTKFTGRGLGLAAVHGIVRGHHGVLEVESELGRGTTFKLLFPAAAGVADALSRPIEAPVSWHGSGCVLVVDDEEAVRQVCSALLTKFGFSVVLAADGREGIEMFQAGPDGYTLVLLDLTMPPPDGRQVFAELRRLRENIGVVLMSGFNEEEVLSGFAGVRPVGFLQKPFEIQSFRDVIRRATGNQASAQ